MIIKNKTAFVYDIEVFPNFFSCAIKNTESGNIKVFEISDRKNEIGDIAKLFLNKNIIWVSFNGIHYDNPIISYILMNFQDLIQCPVWEINSKLKTLSDTIIESQDGNFSSWSKYKYANLFEVLDLLTMMFSSKLRVGLKELQVTMQYKNVQEYDGDFNSYLPEKDYDKLQQYNINDIESTEELLNRLQKDILLRIGIEEEYGVNVLSKDGVSIGKEILKTKYLQDTGKSWKEIKDLRSPCDIVNLNEVIIPSISYETKILQDLLTEMKTLSVNPGINGWSKEFPFFGTMISIGVGGQL